MIRRLEAGPRYGEVTIPASKSQAHRLLICAALGEGETELLCGGYSRDIAATADCLRALGAYVDRREDCLTVRPILRVHDEEKLLPCGESGSTLRFLLPVVGALGCTASFLREGRLPQRPLAPLDAELCRHGMQMEEDSALLRVRGQLRAGDYTMPGDISSQYISGLLLALPLLEGDSCLTVTGKIESAPYIRMTEEALRLAGVRFDKEENRYHIPGGQRCRLPRRLAVEGDWSNAAFFLCMGAFSDKGMLVKGLRPDSAQGDRAVLEILRRFGAQVQEGKDGILVRRGFLRALDLDAAAIPDLIPVLSVVAAGAEGETRIYNAARLRLKESDRLQTTAALLRALGADAAERPDGLLIQGKPWLSGGIVDSAGDHRIAMAAAVAAGLCRGEVEIHGAECVEKSYPRFWQDWEQTEGERP